MTADRLRTALDALGDDIAVALSGGVDSVALMAFAHRHFASRVIAYHAVSAAVPPEATVRVRALSAQHGWRLDVFDAGEVSDEKYLANPVDRCFTCKSHLYDAIRERTAHAQIVSGTNVDDLSDFRPGLRAAAERGVKHPFVDAGLTKDAVRALARDLGLGDIAELPAQPCLSSRVETGTRITPTILAAINVVENALRARVGAHATVRCRVKSDGVEIQLDHASLTSLDERARADVAHEVKHAGLDGAVHFTRYQMGSAFLRVL